jgi:hypothetical protein
MVQSTGSPATSSRGSSRRGSHRIAAHGVLEAKAGYYLLNDLNSAWSDLGGGTPRSLDQSHRGLIRRDSIRGKLDHLRQHGSRKAASLGDATRSGCEGTLGESLGEDKYAQWAPKAPSDAPMSPTRVPLTPLTDPSPPGSMTASSSPGRSFVLMPLNPLRLSFAEVLYFALGFILNLGGRHCIVSVAVFEWGHFVW